VPASSVGRPLQIAAQQSLDRLGQLRGYHVRQTQLLPQREQLWQAKAAVGAYAAQSHVSRQVMPQVEEERCRVVAACGVARAQP
jgi:hypothetical protein